MSLICQPRTHQCKLDVQTLTERGDNVRVSVDCGMIELHRYSTYPTPPPVMLSTPELVATQQKTTF